MNTLTHTVAPPTVERAKITARIIARGSVLGRYEIIGPIGSGATADVWLGRSTGHGGSPRLLAIKTARPSLTADPRLRETFLRAGGIAAGIHHANMVDVLDVGEAGGVLYQVTSLVEGDSFAGLLQAAPLPLGVTLAIVIDALRGLQAAHENAVVHRDVSPQSILVGLDGLARISDFGITDEPSDDASEAPGALRGKPAYFSPEQARNEPLDRRTDVFAMGIVLWEALTGARLFKGCDAAETLEHVRGAPISDPSRHAPALPAAIAAVTMRALERDASARYASADAMADALASAAHEAGVAIDRRAVARTVHALAGARVRAMTREASVDDAPVSGITRRRARTRSWLALPIALLGAAALVVALAARGRAAPPVVAAPPPSAPAVAPSVTAALPAPRPPPLERNPFAAEP